MKIADLFAAIGVQVDDEGVKKFDKSLKSSKRSIGLYIAKITGAIFAIDRFIQKAGKASISLNNFAQQTGVSIQAIQKWQQAASLANLNLGEEEVASSIQSLQDQLTSIKLGGGDISGFQLFHISRPQLHFALFFPASQQCFFPRIL